MCEWVTDWNTGVSYTTYTTPLCSKKTSLLLLPLAQAPWIHIPDTGARIFHAQDVSTLHYTLVSQPLLCHTGFPFASFASLVSEPPKSGPEASSPMASHLLAPSWPPAPRLGGETRFPLCFSLECRCKTERNPGRVLGQGLCFIEMLPPPLSLFHRIFEVICVKKIKLRDDT